MTITTEPDQYGLSPDDEFYGLNQIQVSDQGSVKVHPYTYALMTWFKSRMNQPDTIDIHPSGKSALLTYESTITGLGQDESSSTQYDEFDVDNVIEVQEDAGLVSYFIYIKQPIPDDYVSNVAIQIMNINPDLQFGHFEVYTTNSTGEHFLRFRSSMILKEVKVGKVDSLQHMLETSTDYCSQGLLVLFLDENLKRWILQN